MNIWVKLDIFVERSIQMKSNVLESSKGRECDNRRSYHPSPHVTGARFVILVVVFEISRHAALYK
jgi:hypothetical protein